MSSTELRPTESGGDRPARDCGGDRHAARRRFLRAAGVTLALPLLDRFVPRLRAGERPAPPPRRLVCICTPLGVHAPYFFPEQTGDGYTASPYLEPIDEFRQQYPVIPMSGQVTIRCTAF